MRPNRRPLRTVPAVLALALVLGACQVTPVGPGAGTKPATVRPAASQAPAAQASASAKPGAVPSAAGGGVPAVLPSNGAPPAGVVAPPERRVTPA